METTTINILDYIPYGKQNAISRSALSITTGLEDRTIRKLIAETKNLGALVVNDQDGQGYYQVDVNDLDTIERQYKQDTARAMAILKRRKTMRRILKSAGRDV